MQERATDEATKESIRAASEGDVKGATQASALPRKHRAKLVPACPGSCPTRQRLLSTPRA